MAFQVPSKFRPKFRVPSSIVTIVKDGRTVPDHMFFEIIQSSMPLAYTICTQLANASRAEPARIAQKMLSSGTAEYAEVLEAFANPLIRHILEKGCSCRFRMWTPLSLYAYAYGPEIVPPLTEPIDGVRERFPEGFDFLKLLIVQMPEDGFGKVDVSARKFLVVHDIMSLLAVDSFRDVLRSEWRADIAFRSPGTVAFRDADTIKKDFSDFLGIEDQILNAPVALLATG
jgi:hypothetical protein